MVPAKVPIFAPRSSPLHSHSFRYLLPSAQCRHPFCYYGDIHPRNESRHYWKIHRRCPSQHLWRGRSEQAPPFHSRSRDRTCYRENDCILRSCSRRDSHQRLLHRHRVRNRHQRRMGAMLLGCHFGLLALLGKVQDSPIRMVSHRFLQLYFDADSCRVFCHALRRHWFSSITWTQVGILTVYYNSFLTIT
jgi:hypothetical protein